MNGHSTEGTSVNVNFGPTRKIFAPPTPPPPLFLACKSPVCLFIN